MGLFYKKMEEEVLFCHKFGNNFQLLKSFSHIFATKEVLK